MKSRVVSATEFKAKCLSLLDEIETSGETITITKRGRAAATVGPARKRAWKSLEGAWAGRVQLSGDIVSGDTSNLWEVVRAK